MALRRNVLIFHAGALGDFVLSWPLVMALSRLHPQSRIMCVTAASKGKLAEEIIGVESLDSESGWSGLFAAGAKPPKAVADRLAGAHTIVSFVAGTADAWTANIRRLSGEEATLLSLRGTPPADYNMHASDHLLEQLDSWPAIQSATAAILRSIAQRGVRPARWARPRGGIIVHPGSGSPAKCWPADRFIELIGRLRGFGHDVTAVIGEVERERWTPADMSALGRACPVVQPETYVALAAELDRREIYVGNDSGPTHLAGVLGLEVFGLFGPTHPAVWGPLGPNIRCIHHQPLETLCVDEVYNELKKVLVHPA